MPELPEVETVARDLASQVLGATITGIEKLSWERMVEIPELTAFYALLPGHRIDAVGRRAKWLLISLSEGRTLAIHLRMSGVLSVRAADEPPDKHTHLVLQLDDGRRIFFRDVRKFGRVRLLETDELGTLEGAFGPEPLSEAFDVPTLTAILKRPSALKPLLLNQARIAGIGNIYADEALWESQLHPLRRADSLTKAEITRLHAAIQNVLQRSLERHGSTLRDYRTGYGEKGENQKEFRAYSRTGLPCPRCGTPIERLIVAQRGTHICPACQKVG